MDYAGAKTPFGYAVQHTSYGAEFNEAMSSYSSIDNTLVLEALEHYDFSKLSHLCDVGGGHGLTLCSLLVKYPHLQGTVGGAQRNRQARTVMGR